MAGYQVGDLLVAGLAISDGVFDGTVVLLLDTDDADPASQPPRTSRQQTYRRFTCGRG